MIPTATLLYGGLLLLLFVVLSGNVSRVRIKLGTRGDPTRDKELYRAARAHGNLAESAALAVAMLLACELGGASAPLTHLLGGGYLLARLLHAGGTLAKQRMPHVVGAGLTLLALAAEGVVALYLHFR